MKEAIDALEYNGHRIVFDDGPTTPDIQDFERRVNAVVGMPYLIRDEWNGIEQYVYLGHGWSVCSCGGRSLYVTPSFRPHYSTSDSPIPTPLINALIEIVNNEYDPGIGYEMD